MSKKLWSVLAAGALVASVFTILPAKAQEAPPSATPIPEVVNVEDPKGDANYLNDQGGACTGSPLPSQCTPWQGNNSLPQSAGTVSDILGVWFSHDAQSISAHILTDNPPPASTPLFYRVRVDPDGGGSGCLWFQAFFAGVTQGQTEPTNPTGASLRDTCSTGLGTQTEGVELFVEQAGEDGITTIKVPRALYPTFTDGSVLATPDAHVRNFIAGTATAPQVDNTLPGLDYEITAQDGVISEPPVMEEPPKVQEPKKKNCKKIKNKKKRKKCIKRNRKLANKGCAAYVPGEMGAELETETAVVTDAATEEAPIEIEIPIGEGLTALGGPAPDLASRVKYNVQVDSKDPEAGFFARLESPETDDPDLYVYWDNGTQAAVAGGFNQALVAGPVPGAVNDGVINLNGTGSGGHSELGAEQIDGLRTADCTGYTLDLVNWLGQGGTYTLKLWLGEIQNDPAPRE